jgi:hypothetical protein
MKIRGFILEAVTQKCDSTSDDLKDRTKISKEKLSSSPRLKSGMSMGAANDKFAQYARELNISETEMPAMIKDKDL